MLRFTIVLGLVLVVALIVLPRMVVRRGDINREVAAIIGIRTIHTAQMQYYPQFGKYACSLKDLASADIIDATLASGSKYGYKFTLSCMADGYSVSAEPEKFGTSGLRTFLSDQSVVVHEHYGPETATLQDPILK
jgi:type IV pilus assembly protein PilA